MKKCCCILMACICMLCPCISVKADVIWEPEDPFFRKHSEECEYLDRSYTANGPDGEVIIYKSPESSKEVAKLKNGETVHIYWVYEAENGISWGSFEDEETGWMPMDYLAPVYDSISFAEEYADEIEEESGRLDESYRGKEIYIWNYPGAENVWTIEVSDEMNLPEYSRVYRDENGRRWGNLSYYYGYKDVWICIDEPLKGLSGLYSDGAPEHKTITQEDGEFKEERIVPVPDHASIILAAAAVCLTGLATVILLAVLKRKTLKDKDE